MENSQFNKIKDIRQSGEWQKYQKWLGWTCLKTSKGTNIALRKILSRAVVKIQRPHNLTQKELVEIEKICRKHKALFIKIEPGSNQNLDELKKAGYVKSYHPLLPPSTIFIDLTKPEKKLWKENSKTCRYSIRRAQREGATIEIHNRPSEDILEIFRGLMKQTAQAKKILVPSLKDLKEQINSFGDDSYVTFVKDPQGAYMAGNYYLGFGKNIWYVHGGTSHIARKGLWGYELTWKSFLLLKKRGYKILDQEGIDDSRFPSFTKNWGGFSHFKEKFGGEKVIFPYPHIKLLNPTLKLLQKIYKTLPL
jgi:lipid II:glycine glycyltransferase (peptidoglycan interpeptide bridge formation enzyme)